MNTYTIDANCTPMGEYKGADENAALDAYAQDAGYNGITALLANVPVATRGELAIREIDEDALLAAVESAAGEPVFQDSYGDGIALVKGDSYASYGMLALAFDLDLADFYR